MVLRDQQVLQVLIEDLKVIKDQEGLREQEVHKALKPQQGVTEIRDHKDRRVLTKVIKVLKVREGHRDQQDLEVIKTHKDYKVLKVR